MLHLQEFISPNQLPPHQLPSTSPRARCSRSCTQPPKTSRIRWSRSIHRVGAGETGAKESKRRARRKRLKMGRRPNQIIRQRPHAAILWWLRQLAISWHFPRKSYDPKGNWRKICRVSPSLIAKCLRLGRRLRRRNKPPISKTTITSAAKTSPLELPIPN